MFAPLCSVAVISYSGFWYFLLLAVFSGSMHSLHELFKNPLPRLCLNSILGIITYSYIPNLVAFWLQEDPFRIKLEQTNYVCPYWNGSPTVASSLISLPTIDLTKITNDFHITKSNGFIWKCFYPNCIVDSFFFLEKHFLLDFVLYTIPSPCGSLVQVIKCCYALLSLYSFSSLSLPYSSITRNNLH